MAKTRLAIYPIQDLVKRLKRIQEQDEMTKEDADCLLAAALRFNWQFLKYEGEPKSDKQIRRILWDRILDVVEELA